MNALYECEVAHARTTPLVNRFRYGTYLWLVDVDELPRLPRALRPLAGFRAEDHLGSPDRSIRANVDTYLAANGIDLDGGTVTMLAAARVLGHVFNPLSVFWCHDRTGALVCTIAEVHNTYGERHCYLVRTDALGAADVEKAFYVSPFEPVTGRYRMSLPEPGDRLAISITLHRDGQEPFVASLAGRRRPATAWHLLAMALRHPLAPAVVSLRIRRQGIALWWRELPVVPRPHHSPQEAVR
ncbi:MAG: DUF1365 domain-containing protein [Acidimicrobiales bacterium]